MLIQYMPRSPTGSTAKVACYFKRLSSSNTKKQKLSLSMEMGPNAKLNTAINQAKTGHSNWKNMADKYNTHTRLFLRYLVPSR
jgi:hypothetical protein